MSKGGGSLELEEGRGNEPGGQFPCTAGKTARGPRWMSLSLSIGSIEAVFIGLCRTDILCGNATLGSCLYSGPKSLLRIHAPCSLERVRICVASCSSSVLQLHVVSFSAQATARSRGSLSPICVLLRRGNKVRDRWAYRDQGIPRPQLVKYPAVKSAGEALRLTALHAPQ